MDRQCWPGIRESKLLRKKFKGIVVRICVRKMPEPFWGPGNAFCPATPSTCFIHCLLVFQLLMRK